MAVFPDEANCLVLNAELLAGIPVQSADIGRVGDSGCEFMPAFMPLLMATAGGA